MPTQRRRSETIANRLRGLRELNGLSKGEVARGIGTCRQTVCNWEEYGCISLNDAVKVADFFEVSLETLSGRK